MFGKHEPPTNRSFYLSVATSTFRFAIIVALVVGGVYLISQAFPETPSGELPGGDVIPPTSSPSASTSPTEQPTEGPTPQVAGVILGLYNGTEVTGLAADAAAKLVKRFEYVVPQEAVGDTPTKPVEITTLYYRTADDKVEADFLAANFFKGLDVQIEKLRAGTDIPKDVQVAIYLGNDYAATQQ